MRTDRLVMLSLLLALVGLLGCPLAAEEEKKGEPSPEKAAIDPLLHDVLHFSPEVRVAEAKFRKARAVLQQVRFKVIREALSLRSDLRKLEGQLDAAEQQLAVVQRADQSRAAILEARAPVVSLRAELEGLMLQSDALQGKGIPESLKVAQPEAESTPADGKKKSEPFLQKVLRFSPEVQVAAADLSEAEATLLQARMTVLQGAVELKGQIRKLEAKLVLAEKNLGHLKKLVETAMVSDLQLTKAETEFKETQSQLEILRLRLDVMRGKSLPGLEGARRLPGAADRVLVKRSDDAGPFGTGRVFQYTSNAAGAARKCPAWTGQHAVENLNCTACHQVPKAMAGVGAIVWDVRPAMHNPMIARVLKSLNQPIAIGEGMHNVATPDVLSYLSEQVTKTLKEKLRIRLVGAHDRLGGLSLEAGKMPLGAWLLLIEDSLPQDRGDPRFYVREYGILLSYRAPSGGYPLAKVWPGPVKAEVKK